MRTSTVLGLGRLASTAALVAACVAAWPAPAPAAVPGATRAGEIIVRYAERTPRTARAAANRAAGVHAPRPSAPQTRVVRVRPGRSVAAALRRLRGRADVLYAAPNVLARASAFTPNDPGLTGMVGGWRDAQWNFLPMVGVNAPDAWANLAAVGRPGGRGTVVAVIDSGVAYRTAGRFKASPDLSSSQFVRGYDFLRKDPRPNDAYGHGTHVASTVAERTNNGVGLTGIAYGARIMPIRVLDQDGIGDADDIARGVRYAADHGADVINLSMEFGPLIRARHVPSLIDALKHADRKGVVVVAAGGNSGVAQVAYPARYRTVIAVGATTIHRCAAAYSNYSSRVDLVAPGGGADADLPGDANCNAAAGEGPEILQMTFFQGRPRAFGFPAGYQGTSMAAPHVAAAAALVIASGVVGRDPSPKAVLARLQATAQDLGAAGKDKYYGAGLVDAAAATLPAAPAPPPPTASVPPPA
jgi:serine protease